MLRYTLTLTLVSLAGTVALAQQPVEPSNVLTRLLAMKPTPDLLQWQRIPWARNLQDALRMAREEKRPLFFWASDDEPLDRC